MPNDDTWQDWVGCAGDTESPLAEEREEKEIGERDDSCFRLASEEF